MTRSRLSVLFLALSLPLLAACGQGSGDEPPETTSDSAEVSTAMTDGSHVLVPAGSRLVGRLTEVRPTRGDSAAVIAVAFDSVQVREATLPIAASVTAVDLESRSEMKNEAEKIGIGAAAGALIGAVVGKDVKWAIIGAAGGAAAGTAIALGTQAQYAVLPAGSEMTLELDEPLEVRMPSGG